MAFLKRSRLLKPDARSFTRWILALMLSLVAFVRSSFIALRMPLRFPLTIDVTRFIGSRRQREAHEIHLSHPRLAHPRVA